MNKKILSLAVAAAVAVPLAAQADVSVNGTLERDMYQNSYTNGLMGSESGASKLEFNVKSGDAFAKIAWSPTQYYGMKTAVGTLTGAVIPGLGQREQMVGVKVGGVDIALGRVANTYVAGTKVDRMHATFLESRDFAGGVTKVPSFMSGMLAISGAAGDIKYGIQYGPAYTDMGLGSNNPVSASVNMKAGPVDLGVGYNGSTSGDSTTGISAKGKIGDISLGVSYEMDDAGYNSNGEGSSPASGTNNIVFVDAGMPLGSGTIGLGVGSNTTTSKTFTRVSYDMKVGGAAKLIVGTRSSDGETRTGVGLALGF